MGRSISDIAKEISRLEHALQRGELSPAAHEAAKGALLAEMTAASGTARSVRAPAPLSTRTTNLAAEGNAGSTPSGAHNLRIAASGMAFLLALGLLAISGLQLLAGAGLALGEAAGEAQDVSSTTMWLIAAWNLLIVALHVGIGIGIIQKKLWAYKAGIGTGVVNVVLTFISVLNGACIMVPLVPMDALMVVLLLMAKTDFPAAGWQDLVDE